MSILSRSLITKLVKLSSPASFFSKDVSSFRLNGVYPTVVTPFNEQRQEIDFGRFELLLRHLNRFPFAGFALLGTSAEFASLSQDKKVDIVKFARSDLGESRLIIAGAGSESTNETVELIQKMDMAGADATFVYNPTYFRERMDTFAYLEHFTKIADNSPIPVILYNIPRHMELDIPIEVICELAKHEKIVGLIDAGGDITRIATICMKTKNQSGKFNVVAGSGGFFLPAMTVGCTGAVCSLANILPFEMCNLQDLYNEGKMDKAQHMQWRMLMPNEAITTKYGVPGLKAVIRLAYGIDTGSVRSPLRNLTPEEEKACFATFTGNGFLAADKSESISERT